VLLLEQEQANMKKDIENKDNTYHTFETTQQSEKKSLQKSNEQLKAQLSNAHTTIVAMDARLKKRAAVEESLTKQLSDMARTTAEMSASKDVAESDRESSKLSYETDIQALNNQIEDLKHQLKDASKGLSTMVQDQEQVCLLAQNYEEKMAMSHNQHETIQNSVNSQKEFFEIIRTQRDTIVSLLNTQMEQLDLMESNHKNVTTALETQGKDLESVEYLRNMMLDCALKQKQDMCDRIDDIHEGLKQVDVKEGRLSEDVIEKISMTSAEEEDDVRDETPFENDTLEADGSVEERTEKKEDIDIVNATAELVDAGNVKKIVKSFETNIDDDDKIKLSAAQAEIVAE